jgi:hypothetical protein
MLSLLRKSVGAGAVLAGLLAVAPLAAGAHAPSAEWPTFYDSHGSVGVQPFMHSSAFETRFHPSPLSASLSAKLGKVLKLLAYEPPGPPHPMLLVMVNPTGELEQALATRLTGVVSVREHETRVVREDGKYVRTTFRGSVPTGNGTSTVEQGIAYDFVHGSRELLIYVLWPLAAKHTARYEATADAVASSVRFD